MQTCSHLNSFEDLFLVGGLVEGCDHAVVVVIQENLGHLQGQATRKKAGRRGQIKNERHGHRQFLLQTMGGTALPANISLSLFASVAAGCGGLVSCMGVDTILFLPTAKSDENTREGVKN